jgi:hypothetical protein
MMRHKRGPGLPERVIRKAGTGRRFATGRFPSPVVERMNSWGLMVALISEGLGIHLGEESWLAQYDFVIGDAETMDGSLPGEDYRFTYEGREVGENFV